MSFIRMEKPKSWTDSNLCCDKKNIWNHSFVTELPQFLFTVHHLGRHYFAWNQRRHTVHKSGGGGNSNVVGIICPPPSWNRVNWSAKNWPPDPQPRLRHLWKPLTFFEDDIFQWQHYLPNSVIWVMEIQAAELQVKKLELWLKPAPLHCIGAVKKHTDRF